MDELIQAAKAERLVEEIDDRIRRVERLLGESSDPWCKHCKVPARIMGHTEDCALRKIDPDVLEGAKEDAGIELRKNVNKQRIFKSDKKRWSGLPSGGKTLVKKRRTKNRGPARELRRCRVCCKQTIFENTTGKWICYLCKHIQPCEFDHGGRNCQKCHPNNQRSKTARNE